MVCLSYVGVNTLHRGDDDGGDDGGGGDDDDDDDDAKFMYVLLPYEDM
jgi:hypothetical protein